MSCLITIHRFIKDPGLFDTTPFYCSKNICDTKIIYLSCLEFFHPVNTPCNMFIYHTIFFVSSPNQNLCFKNSLSSSTIPSNVHVWKCAVRNFIYFTTCVTSTIVFWSHFIVKLHNICYSNFISLLCTCWKIIQPWDKKILSTLFIFFFCLFKIRLFG